jgi:DNA-binding HxlR family transcriptional regulator
VVGISDKVLIQHLKELEADLVIRTDFREIPPRVEYSLTEFGSALIETLIPLCKWGKQNMAADRRPGPIRVLHPPFLSAG